jgi:hypothetical protein
MFDSLQAKGVSCIGSPNVGANFEKALLLRKRAQAKKKKASINNSLEKLSNEKNNFTLFTFFYSFPK